LINYFHKNYFKTGIIEISKDCIRIKKKHFVKRFILKNLSKININYNSYKGELIIDVDVAYTKTGEDNNITFIHEGKKNEYNFLITEEDSLYDLKYLFQQWKLQKIDVRFYEKGKSIS